MTRKDATHRAQGNGPEEKGGNPRLLTILGATLIVGALLLAWQLDRDRVGRREELRSSFVARPGGRELRHPLDPSRPHVPARHARRGRRSAHADVRLQPRQRGAGRTMAFWDGADFTPTIHYVLGGTPSDIVMKRGRFFCPDDARIQFPDDDLLHTLGVCSYNGVTLYDSDGQARGIMAVMDTKPMHKISSRVQSFLEIFAARDSAELIRLGSEWRTHQLNVELERRVEKRTNELRDAQDQLIEAEKMSALGTLVAGVAHVLTQLLSNSVIHGFSDGRAGEVFLTISSNGPSWRLTYEDNGLGMDPETIRRVYEPFYTTRRGASGTGLGMHIVYNTVTRSLGGTIRCESRPDQGTRFEVVCPHEAHVPAEVPVAV